MSSVEVLGRGLRENYCLPAKLVPYESLFQSHRQWRQQARRQQKLPLAEH
jgi:hypothetical protein